MDTLPRELVIIIATMAPELFTTCATFAGFLDCQHVKYDAMIACGYSVTISNFYTSWRKNGRYHRLDGPAFEVTGEHWINEWYVDGLLHRIGGPAIEAKFWCQYYEHGVYIRGEDLDPSTSS